ncbi:hypothetical protein BB561_006083 [Smittium simulii]|uniref:Uncharacterized protein n=1 Tax=Smittium simulii TaxID=133385 RepID=A0A2T9Y6P4_9FUNG|nr:hypothetical protein BB561_006083 [Smittium simulii]
MPEILIAEGLYFVESYLYRVEYTLSTNTPEENRNNIPRPGYYRYRPFSNQYFYRPILGAPEVQVDDYTRRYMDMAIEREESFFSIFERMRQSLYDNEPNAKIVEIVYSVEKVLCRNSPLEPLIYFDITPGIYYFDREKNIFYYSLRASNGSLVEINSYRDQYLRVYFRNRGHRIPQAQNNECRLEEIADNRQQNDRVNEGASTSKSSSSGFISGKSSHANSHNRLSCKDNNSSSSSEEDLKPSNPKKKCTHRDQNEDKNCTNESDVVQLNNADSTLPNVFLYHDELK